MNFVQFPAGIATYSGPCDYYAWDKPADEHYFLFDDFDLFMIVAGAMDMTWSNGFKARVRPGQFAIVPPYTPVRVRRVQRGTSYWFCHFSFRMLPGNMHLRVQEDYRWPGMQVSVPVIFSTREAPAVRKMYDKLGALKFGRGAAPWQFESALLRLVGELKRFGWMRYRNNGKSASTQQAATDPRVAAVIQRISADPARRWTTTELADGVGLSTDRLNVLTQRIARKTIKQLILGARFELAFRLLRDETPQRASIKEVSAKCGFSSQHFFCRQFKARFKMTPSEFRDSTLLT